MGIEPTSEAWEAWQKPQNVRIGGILTFFDFLKWTPIGATVHGFSSDVARNGYDDSISVAYTVKGATQRHTASTDPWH
jgi:hypothetical protein